MALPLKVINSSSMQMIIMMVRWIIHSLNVLINTAATCIADKITMGSAVELFYIKGNYNKDATKKRNMVNYLIQCTSATECKVYKISAKEVGKEHFVHGDACKLLETAKDKEIYINANNDNLIHCSEEKKDVKAELLKLRKKNNEFFLNASNLNNESDKLTNDLSKCKLDEITNKIICISFHGKTRLCLH